MDFFPSQQHSYLTVLVSALLHLTWLAEDMLSGDGFKPSPPENPPMATNVPVTLFRIALALSDDLSSHSIPVGSVAPGTKYAR